MILRTKIKFLIASSVITGMFVPVILFAQDTRTNTISLAHTENEQGETMDAAMQKREELRAVEMEKKEMMRTEAQGVRSDAMEKRQMLNDEAHNKREMLQTNLKIQRETLQAQKDTLPKEELTQKREEFRTDAKEQREAVRTVIHEKREAFRDDAQERIEALKKKIAEEQARRIEAFFGRMARKFEAAITRFRDLAERIELRLNKLEDEGRDVAVHFEKLDAARLQIDATEDALERAKDEFYALIGSDNLRDAFGSLKEVVAHLAESVRVSHASLVSVINSIKGPSTESNGQ